MKRNLVTCVLLLLTSYIFALPKSSSIESDQQHLHPQSSRNSVGTETDFIDGIYNECLNKDSLACLKYKMYNFIDKILEKRESISLTDGVTVVQNANSAPLNDNEGTPRELPKTDSFETLLWNRIQKFFETHSVKVDVQGKEILSAVSSTGRALEEFFDYETDNEIAEESRGKKKKAAKIMGPLMAAAAVKLAALVPLALGAIAVVAGKALLIGKIALVISAIIGLKKLLSSQKHVTYEVVSHHGGHGSSGGGGGGGHEWAGSSDISSGGGGGGGGYSSGPGGSSHGSSGGWGRSLNEEQSGQNLAYRAHFKNKV